MPWCSLLRSRTSLYLAVSNRLWFLRFCSSAATAYTIPVNGDDGVDTITVSGKGDGGVAPPEPVVVYATSFNGDGVEVPPEPVHPWPEWVSFVDCLNNNGYVTEDSVSSYSKVVAGGLRNNDSLYRSLHRLKKPCDNFARDRFDIIKSLSREDIQIVLHIGCPNLLRKVVNSAKRLRAYAGLDEGDVCSLCVLQEKCERAFLLPMESEAAARTVDIVRILVYHALDSLVSAEEKSPERKLVEASTRKLLFELIRLSETPPDPVLPKPVFRVSVRKEEPIEYLEELPQNLDMKKGDWICPKCKFMNFSRNKECRRCKEEGPKRVGVDEVEMKTGDWFCPQCRFMNFACNQNCLRCHDPRPEDSLRHGEWWCPSCNYLNFRRNKTCLKCTCDGPELCEVDVKEA